MATWPGGRLLGSDNKHTIPSVSVESSELWVAPQGVPRLLKTFWREAAGSSVVFAEQFPGLGREVLFCTGD